MGAKSSHLCQNNKQFFSAAGSVVSIYSMVVVVWAFISKEDYRAEVPRVVTALQALFKLSNWKNLSQVESSWCGSS